MVFKKTDLQFHSKMKPGSHFVCHLGLIWIIKHEIIRVKKCLDSCQHKTKFVLTSIKIDLTLEEIYSVVLDIGSGICQINM